MERTPCGQAAMHLVVASTISLVGLWPPVSSVSPTTTWAGQTYAGLPRHLAEHVTSDLQAVTHFCCSDVGWGDAGSVSVGVWATTAATRPKARKAAENFIVVWFWF